MKVTIQNLGAIQQAEIDLKPLTILIGPNNAGKTWLAYTIAGIFGMTGWGEYTDAYAEGDLEEKYPPLDAAIENVQTSGRATINLVEFAEQYGEQYFQAVARYARQWMPEYMSTQLAHFEQMDVSIDLAASKARFLEKIKQSSIQREIAGGAFKISKRRDNPKIQAYTSIEKTEQGETITETIPPEEIKESLIDNVMQIMHQAIYPGIRLFPTERTALVAAQFRQHAISTQVPPDENARKIKEILDDTFKQLQNLVNINLDEELDTPRQAIEPLGRFMSMLSSLMRIGTKEIARREKEAQRNPKIRRYQVLAQMLEEQLLFGSLAFSTPEPDPRRSLLFHPHPDVALEMPIVSSMVKELSSLVLYLRYLAQPGELLVIDEPEMNLHPEAQTQMIEFLCLLVNAGLRVLVTTHSTFVVDHLANLIYASQLEAAKRKEAAEYFFLEDEDAFMAQDNVSVYCVDKGTAENILHENGRIDWHTFGDISDQISRIYLTL
ncbi:MAG TPA: AAA family ATPase [Ktedonobacteraceae bacterium]|nr:AAA family ATPase [Ktedonobacteraceae bacterium]